MVVSVARHSEGFPAAPFPIGQSAVEPMSPITRLRWSAGDGIGFISERFAYSLESRRRRTLPIQTCDDRVRRFFTAMSPTKVETGRLVRRHMDTSFMRGKSIHISPTPRRARLRHQGGPRASGHSDESCHDLCAKPRLRFLESAKSGAAISKRMILSKVSVRCRLSRWIIQ